MITLNVYLYVTLKKKNSQGSGLNDGSSVCGMPSDTGIYRLQFCWQVKMKAGSERSILHVVRILSCVEISPVSFHYIGCCFIPCVPILFFYSPSACQMFALFVVCVILSLNHCPSYWATAPHPKVYTEGIVRLLLPACNLTSSYIFSISPTLSIN